MGKTFRLRVLTVSKNKQLVHLHEFDDFKIPVVQGYSFRILLHYGQATIYNLSFSRQKYLLLL